MLTVLQQPRRWKVRPKAIWRDGKGTRSDLRPYAHWAGTPRDGEGRRLAADTVRSSTLHGVHTTQHWPYPSNPGGEKYDPVRHGEAGKAPAATGPTLIKSEPAATDKQGIMRQIL